MPKTATPRKPETVSRKLAETRAKSKNRSLSSLLGIGDNEKRLATDIGSGLNDVIGRGTIAGLLGLPGDLAGAGENTLRSLLGLPQVTPYGGSEHIGQKMEQAGLVSNVRRPKTELLASLISPAQAATAGYKAPQMARAGAKALDNLSAPRTMGRQQGAIENLWHGSPHTFDRFDMDKAGSGTGANAYGRGTYLTESPDVAKTYKAHNSATAKFEYDGKPIDDEIKQSVAWHLEHFGGDKDAVKAYWMENFKPSYWETPLGKKELKTLDKMDYGKLNAGNIYQTRLAWPDSAKEASEPLSPEHFLDFNAPLKDQPEILAKLQESGLLEKSMKQGGFYQQDIPSGFFKGEHMLGMNGARGRFGNPLDSQELNQAGIPGIRYLDEGAGSHNYVVFDDKLIDIVGRNGQPVGNLGKMVAPQDEALRVAQANAAKPVEISDIRPSKENLARVISANTTAGKVVGDSMMPIDSLVGGVGREVTDLRRVDDLAAKMSAPDGYLERLIVDDAGNVIEGQHRLEALRKIGVKDVPVTVIRDSARGFPSAKVEDAIKAAQPMRSDHVNQISSYLASALADEGGDVSKLMQYQPPRGYEAAWKAGLDALLKP